MTNQSKIMLVQRSYSTQIMQKLAYLTEKTEVKSLNFT